MKEKKARYALWATVVVFVLLCLYVGSYVVLSRFFYTETFILLGNVDNSVDSSFTDPYEAWTFTDETYSLDDSRAEEVLYRVYWPLISLDHRLFGKTHWKLYLEQSK